MKTYWSKTRLLIIGLGLVAGLTISFSYIGLQKKSHLDVFKKSNQMSLDSLAENIGIFVKIGDLYNLHKTVSLFQKLSPLSQLDVIDNSGTSLVRLSSFQSKSDSIAFHSSVKYSGENLGTIKYRLAQPAFRLSGLDYAFCLAQIFIFLFLANVISNQVLRRFQSETHYLQNINKLRRQVAHDIASPLSALNLVVGTLPDSLEAQRELSKKAVEQIQNIAKDLKDSTKSVDQSFDIIALINEVAEQKKCEYSHVEGLHLNFTIEKGSSSQIMGNPVEVKRILSNLINNSVQAIPAEAEHKKIEIQVARFESRVSIKLTDNGPGIKRAHLKKIFKEGFTHGKTVGTGLGLYHAKNEMKRIGGRILVSSQKNLGTTFELQFPV